MMVPVSNWQRWGKADERGSFNLIGPEAVKRGLAAAHTGRVLSLGHVIGSSNSPVMKGRRAAIQHYMLRDGGDPPYSESKADFVYAEDYFGLPIHSTSTHVDALCHGWSDGQMYNGYPATSVNSRGAMRCGIEKMGPIVTRAILVDMPRHLGMLALPQGFAIQAEHLDAAFAGLPPLEPGDALLVRTGSATANGDRPRDIPLEHPGLDLSTAAWLHERDVSLVGADTLAVEVVPSPTGAFSPLHVVLIRDLGMAIVELLNLEQLALEGHVECCLVISPLPIQGGTGSPVCPVAIV